MSKQWLDPVVRCMAVSLLALFCVAQAGAQSLLERAQAGETIRIGYSNEAPYAYPNERGEMDGFVNVVGLEILNRLGIENVEGVLTEWGSLIPGLQANRFDIITAGMFILPNRCEQVAFTEPMGVFAEAILVTGAGYSTVQHARTVDIPDERIM